MVLSDCEERYRYHFLNDQDKGRDWALHNLDKVARKLKKAASEGRDSFDFQQPRRYASRLKALDELLNQSGFTTELIEHCSDGHRLVVSGWARLDKA